MNSGIPCQRMRCGSMLHCSVAAPRTAVDTDSRCHGQPLPRTAVATDSRCHGQPLPQERLLTVVAGDSTGPPANLIYEVSTGRVDGVQGLKCYRRERATARYFSVLA